MRWHVSLSQIEWDDGDGEYDVSELPRALAYAVETERMADAIELAMSEASDDTGSLIYGCKAKALVIDE